MAAGEYKHRMMHLAQTSTRGRSGAEVETYAETGPVYWCNISEAESPGVPGGKAGASEMIEDNYIKSVQRMLVKIRNQPAISPKDRLVDLRNGNSYAIVGIRLGVNELLVNVETA